MLPLGAASKEAVPKAADSQLTLPASSPSCSSKIVLKKGSLSDFKVLIQHLAAMWCTESCM